MPASFSKKNELILKALQSEGENSLTLLPGARRRKLLIDFAKSQSSFDSNFKITTQGTILDQSKLNIDEATTSIVAPHNLATSYPEETHQFIINDITFSINPQHIHITQDANSKKDFVIRTTGMAKTKSGTSFIYINVTLPFVGAEEINSKLRRLIAQIRTLPIAYIDNPIIRQVVFPDNKLKNMAVSISNANLSTHPESPETLLLTLSMEVFNYFPYSDDFFFVNLPSTFHSDYLKDKTEHISSPKKHKKTIKQPTTDQISKPVLAVNPKGSFLFQQYYDYILGDADTPSTNKAIIKGANRKYTFTKVLDELNGNFELTYYIYHQLPISAMSVSPPYSIDKKIVAQEPRETDSVPKIENNKKYVNNTDAQDLTGSKQDVDKIVSYAIKKFLGWSYSMDRRYENGFVDCSSMIMRLLEDPNVNIGYIGFTSTIQPQILTNMSNQGVHAWLRVDGALYPIPIMYMDNDLNRVLSQLPGVLIYTPKKNPYGIYGKQKTPTFLYRHVSITTGSNNPNYVNVFEAANSARGVVKSIYKIHHVDNKTLFLIPNGIYDYKKHRNTWNKIFNKLNFIPHTSEFNVNIHQLSTILSALNPSIPLAGANPKEYKKKLTKLNHLIKSYNLYQEMISNNKVSFLKDDPKHPFVRFHKQRGDNAFKKLTTNLENLEYSKIKEEIDKLRKELNLPNYKGDSVKVKRLSKWGITVRPKVTFMHSINKEGRQDRLSLVDNSERQIKLAKAAKTRLKDWAVKIKKFLERSKLHKQEWELVWLKSGTAVFRKPVTITFGSDKILTYNDQDNQNLIPLQTTISISNMFARIPMIGHAYSTQQFLGSGDAEAIITFYAKGNGPIGTLEYIQKYNEYASRLLRRIPDVGVIAIKNEILNLVGSHRFLIDKIEVNTVEHSPELYQVQVKLTEWKRDQFDNYALNQEFTMGKKVKQQILDRTLSLLFEKYRVELIEYLPEDGFKHYYQLRAYNKKCREPLTPELVEKKRKNPRIKIDRTDSLMAYVLEKINIYFKELQGDNYLHMLGYSLPDFLKAQADPKHPFYAFNAFRFLSNANYQRHFIKDFFTTKKVNNKYVTPLVVLNMIGGSIQGIPSLWSRIWDANFNNKNTNRTSLAITYNHSMKKLSLYKELKSYNRHSPALTQFLNNYRIKTNSFHNNKQATGFWYGVSDSLLSIYRDLVNYLIPSNISKYYKKLNHVFGPDVERYINQFPNLSWSRIVSLDKYNLVKKNYTYTLHNEIKKQQILLGISFINFFYKFRDDIAKLINASMDTLSTSPDFQEIFKHAEWEDEAFGGLPAYQDIPLPKIEIDNPLLNDLRNKADIINRKSLYTWLNPDFFFYNADDYDGLALKKALKYEGRARKMFSDSLSFAYEFGQSPSQKEDKTSSGSALELVGDKIAKSNVKGGRSFFLASVGAYYGSHRNQIGNVSRFNANNLPDSLFYSLGYQKMTHDQKKGKAGNHTMNLGISDSGIASSNYHGKQVSKLPDHFLNRYGEIDKQASTLYQNTNPMGLDKVTFGVTGSEELRLPVLLDRNPVNLLEAFTKSFTSYKKNSYKLRRALPAFKLYFIEDDTSGLNGGDASSFVRSHDDFFSFSAVKEIKFISSRKIPADLLIIRLSNLFGYLDDSKFALTNKTNINASKSTQYSPSGREALDAMSQDTYDENPFARFILKEGVRVQFKIGYENDPKFLPTKLNGQIVQINQVDSNEIIIVCQSFGTQLVAYKKGERDSSIQTEWIDTFDLLSWAISQPEVSSFGRWQLNIGDLGHGLGSIGESRSTGGWEKIFDFLKDPRDDNLFAPSRQDMLTFRSDDSGGIWSYMMNIISTKTFKPQQATWLHTIGNIRVYGVDTTNLPSLDISTGTVKKTSNKKHRKVVPMVKERTKGKKQVVNFFNTYDRGDSPLLDYHVYRTTIWDIFKEMELRHPGWIGHPAIYSNRMTMFFGQPTQLYWSRPPTQDEKDNIASTIRAFKNKALGGQTEASRIYREALKAVNKEKNSTVALLRQNKVYKWSMRHPKLTVLATFGAELLFYGIVSEFIPWAGTGIINTGSKVFRLATLTEKTIEASRILRIGTKALSYAKKAGSFVSKLKIIKGTAKAAKGISSATWLATKIAGGVIIGGIGTGLTLASMNTNLPTVLYQQSILTMANRQLAMQLMKQRLAGRLIPYRNYHLITSENHIVANNIKTSVHGTYNAVTLEYTKDKDEDGNVKNSGVETETKSMKASDRILDKDIRMRHASYPNCRGRWMADRYMQGLLLRDMKDIYKGQLLILGDPTIKPYDRVMIMDSYTDMYGSIEVEQVVDTLSPQTGYLTEITPDFILYGNNIVDMPFDDYIAAKLAWEAVSFRQSVEAILHFNGSVYQKLLKDKAGIVNGKYTGNTAANNYYMGDRFKGTGVKAATSAAGAGIIVAGIAAGGISSVIVGGAALIAGALHYDFKLGWKSNLIPYFGTLGIKLYEWSTQRQPFIFNPLYVAGKPLLAGVQIDKVGIAQYAADRFIPILKQLNIGIDTIYNLGETLIYSKISSTLQEIEPGNERK